MPEFEFADGLKSACRFCTSLSRLTYREASNRGVIPTEEEPTATVTFIKFDGKTYAITAKHVISQFDDLATSEGHEFGGYFCPVGPGTSILGPFITPPATLDYQKPDISICPIRSELPPYIGKEAFDITPEGNASWPVEYAMAVGYPTGSKVDVSTKNGTQLAMSCARAVAEGLSTSSKTSDQVQFFSELPYGTTVMSLSGMSGGPVFWSVEEAFGLLGFVKETMENTPNNGTNFPVSSPRVHFLSQRVDYDIFSRWLSYVDSEYPIAREKINARIREIK